MPLLWIPGDGSLANTLWWILNSCKHSGRRNQSHLVPVSCCAHTSAHQHGNCYADMKAMTALREQNSFKPARIPCLQEPLEVAEINSPILCSSTVHDSTMLTELVLH